MDFKHENNSDARNSRKEGNSRSNESSNRKTGFSRENAHSGNESSENDKRSGTHRRSDDSERPQRKRLPKVKSKDYHADRRGERNSAPKKFDGDRQSGHIDTRPFRKRDNDESRPSYPRRDNNDARPSYPRRDNSESRPSFRPKNDDDTSGSRYRENNTENKSYHKRSENSDDNRGARPRFEGNERAPFYKSSDRSERSGSPRKFETREKPEFNRTRENDGGNDRSSRKPSFDNERGGQKSYGRNNDNSRSNDRPSYDRNRGGSDNDRGGERKSPYSAKKRVEFNTAKTIDDGPMRLNRFIAQTGISSRRQADEYIKAGLVRINGEIVTQLGVKVTARDEVKFDDSLIKQQKKVYILLNKPKNYVTTVDDPHAEFTVMDLIKDACRERVYPIGRLDKSTTGVLLLTNDGELTKQLTHPTYNKKKVYHVYLEKNLRDLDMENLAKGIELEDGNSFFDEISYIDPNDKKQVGVEIHSGKNRIIRRMFEKLGYTVIKLDRVYFAGLTKKGVARGEWRFLRSSEVGMLRMGTYE